MAAIRFHRPIPILLLDSRAIQRRCVAQLLGLPLVQPPDQLRVVAQRLIPIWLILILMMMILQCRLSSLTTPESAVSPSSTHLNMLLLPFKCSTYYIRWGGSGVGRLELLGVE